MKVIPTPLNPRTQFWGPALLMMPLCWVVGTVSLMVRQGETFPRSAVLASFGAFGGLLLWLTYRAASRRRDGLAAFFMGMIVATAPQKHGSLWGELGGCVFPLVIMALGLYVVGLFLRQRSKASPLSNADSDLT
ncbi:hypothetical protein V5E97_10995 [Singulisphaera sp. Ch08]|uniref:Transmembrane protein n=1 Tax=Singulisphaera sp. Ch08 TaxID=3120278 RepID=A0AAU7CNE9_9BACT